MKAAWVALVTPAVAAAAVGCLRGVLLEAVPPKHVQGCAAAAAQDPVAQLESAAAAAAAVVEVAVGLPLLGHLLVEAC